MFSVFSLSNLYPLEALASLSLAIWRSRDPATVLVQRICGAHHDRSNGGRVDPTAEGESDNARVYPGEAMSGSSSLAHASRVGGSDMSRPGRQ